MQTLIDDSALAPKIAAYLGTQLGHTRARKRFELNFAQSGGSPCGGDEFRRTPFPRGSGATHLAGELIDRPAELARSSARSHV